MATIKPCSELKPSYNILLEVVFFNLDCSIFFLFKFAYVMNSLDLDLIPRASSK